MAAILRRIIAQFTTSIRHDRSLWLSGVECGRALWSPSSQKRKRLAARQPQGVAGACIHRLSDTRIRFVSEATTMDAMELMQRHEADQQLEAFVRESNRIEGIHRDPTREEIKAHKTLIARKRVKVEHVTALVAVCQPNAVLRASANLPPPGQRMVCFLVAA